MKYIPGKRHILYESARDIREIARPLQTYFNIKEFTYEKIYHNNLKIKLSNQPEWLNYFYDNGFHLHGDETIDALSSEVNLTSTLTTMNQDKFIFDPCRDLFQIGNGVLLIDFFDDYRELYWFTSDEVDEKTMLYHKNIDLLKVFIKSFKEKAAPIIRRAECDKILRPGNCFYLPGNQEDNPTFPNADAFLKEMALKRYPFQRGDSVLYLTQRELECALELMKGRTAKEIANLLFVSSRTIEKHIENIKLKTATCSKRELVSLLWEFGINIYMT